MKQTLLLEDNLPELDFFEEENEEQEEEFNSDFDISQISQIVVYGTDWTTETILNQLIRENIQLNPRFQRRDAWTIQRKSRFIESLILGLPVPQLVLAEQEKGKYLILDGKQRLLSILQFYGKSESPNNNFKLKDLEFLKELNGSKYEDLKTNYEYADILTALDNQTIRTTMIRNWQSEDFLYKVFLRLNVENTVLSPQELRQALNPGKFTNFIDDQSIQSKALRKIFKSQNPDFRMRDAELLLRYVAFQYFLSDYRGNLKEFLDETCKRINKKWNQYENQIKETVDNFEQAVQATIDIFGQNNFSRVWSSKPNKYRGRFNRYVLDVMTFYFSDKIIREKALDKKEEVEEAFKNLCCQDRNFVESLEKSTNTVQKTYNRLSLWGKALLDVLDIEFNIPQLDDNNHIIFNGLR
jgi:hypothetical protein